RRPAVRVDRDPTAGAGQLHHPRVEVGAVLALRLIRGVERDLEALAEALKEVDARWGRHRGPSPWGLRPRRCWESLDPTAAWTRGARASSSRLYAAASTTRPLATSLARPGNSFKVTVHGSSVRPVQVRIGLRWSEPGSRLKAARAQCLDERRLGS